MRRRIRTLAVIALASTAAAQTWPPTSPYPTWANSAPTHTVQFDYDTGMTSAQNGEALRVAMVDLLPGERLQIGPGTYSISAKLTLRQAGTAAAPVWIEGRDPNDRPVITRPDTSQNTVNVGSGPPSATFIALRHLEVTGGADLMRLWDCTDIWIDHCYLHDGGGLGIAAQSHDTQRIFVTNNEVARTGPGTLGEGMYFGASNGSKTTSWSVFAFNYVHDLQTGTDGDGIEIKQNSHHNWIVGNHVARTRNPCILVYGTGGNGQNLVENNLMHESLDAVLQVQGDAIVRNNIAIGGAYSAFLSFDHNDTSTNLQIVHNTFINGGLCAQLTFNEDRTRTDMVFANNVAYSRTDDAMRFGRGIGPGHTIVGNVIVGDAVNAVSGFEVGTGLADLAGASWDGTAIDVTPIVGGPVDNRGTQIWTVATDDQGTARTDPPDPGARSNAVTLQADVDVFAVATGGVQTLQLDANTPRAGSFYRVLGTLSGTATPTITPELELPFVWDSWSLVTLSNPNSPAFPNTAGFLDGQGRATAMTVLPPLPPQLAGLQFHYVFVVWQGPTPQFASNPVPLSLQ